MNFLLAHSTMCICSYTHYAQNLFSRLQSTRTATVHHDIISYTSETSALILLQSIAIATAAIRMAEFEFESTAKSMASDSSVCRNIVSLRSKVLIPPKIRKQAADARTVMYRAEALTVCDTVENGRRYVRKGLERAGKWHHRPVNC